MCISKRLFGRHHVWGISLAGDLFSGHEAEGMLGGMNMFGGCLGRACLEVFFSMVCFDDFFRKMCLENMLGEWLWIPGLEIGLGGCV